MIRIPFTVIAMYLSMVVFSQTRPANDSLYKSKKLKLEEVNFVSSYYNQDGNNSAVTGGIGSEKLTDFANTIELKLSKYDSKYRKHNFSFEVGVDHYTSASSDKIDPHTLSSASRSDTRFYPSASWSIQNEKKETTIGVNASFSNEFDYTSFGLGTSFTKTSKNHNTEFTGKLQAYFDTWKVIYPVELRTGNIRGENDYPSAPRNSYSASLSLSQIINKKLQILLVAEPTYQTGLLATKYQRVYFADGSVQAENLPDNRYKIPVGIRANYFIGDRFIIRSFYRYYNDNWGVKAHTVDLEVPIKITPFVSVSPFYRFYKQTAADFFAAYGQHTVSENYFTSDYDLSKFNSNFFGASIRLAPPNGLLGMKNWNSLELRYGRYERSNGLQSNIISLHLKFK
jgi:hypothetical protein